MLPDLEVSPELVNMSDISNTPLLPGTSPAEQAIPRVEHSVLLPLGSLRSLDGCSDLREGGH